MGIVTDTIVNNKLEEFNKLLEWAKTEGADTDQVIIRMGPSLKKLADQAKDLGVQVQALDDVVKRFNDIVNVSVDAGFEK